MYVGRIVSVGLTMDSKLCVMYRVSSRSFPHREISTINDRLAVVPSKGFESDIYENPYISYHCLRHDKRYAVVGNGTHCDPIFEKLQTGMSLRDSLTMVLFAMDYEHDNLATPRIAAVVDKATRKMALGVVREEAIEVQVFDLTPGCYRYLSTYVHNTLSEDFSGKDFAIDNANEATGFIKTGGCFNLFSHAVSSAAAIETDDGFSIAHDH